MIHITLKLREAVNERISLLVRNEKLEYKNRFQRININAAYCIDNLKKHNRSSDLCRPLMLQVLNH